MSQMNKPEIIDLDSSTRCATTSAKPARMIAGIIATTAVDESPARGPDWRLEEAVWRDILSYDSNR